MAKKIALKGLFLALIILLSLVESYVVPPNIYNIRPGLSNVIIMYTLITQGRGAAVSLALAKSLFVLLSRGAVAFSLSLTGGILAIAAMIITDRLYSGRTSYSVLSISGALFHNLGQLLTASLIIGSFSLLLFYLPVLVISAIGCGVLTGVVLKFTMPYLDDLR